MVAIRHLISPANLPTAQTNLSVLSYNVLLPNSEDGWWTYKMYSPPLPPGNHASSWEHRQKLLLHRIGEINADVVCLQEVSPSSFHEDFAFMREELGYDGVELFKRGRFRPATFWKSTKCQLVAPPVHKDRTLLTAFRLVPEEEEEDVINVEGGGKIETDKSSKQSHQRHERYWHVLNCHLQAGPEGGRRVRQIHEGVRASFNLANKLKEKEPDNPHLVVCGDFNGGSECGAVRYLEDGGVGPDFIEDGEPVTSKQKKSPLSKPMKDVPSLITTRSAPPTMVVTELISIMVKKGTEAYIVPELSEDVLERLERIYNRFATHVVKPNDDVDSNNGSPFKVMNCSDVERWLEIINGQVGRGDEFREAARQMGWVDPTPPSPLLLGNEVGQSIATGEQVVVDKPRITLPKEGILKLDGFNNVYQRELRGGKFWGIAHDLAILGEALPNVGLFEGRYDRMYCSDSITPTAILDTTSSSPCPSETEPSDHLPIAASFTTA